MTCTECGAACQGALCQQCGIEKRFAHLADELAEADFSEDGDDA